MKPGRDDSLAEDVTEIERIVVNLLRGEGNTVLRSFEEWLGGLAPRARRRDRNQFPFGIAQGGKLAAEHASGINVDGAVEPFRFGDRRMPIHHHRLSAV